MMNAPTQGVSSAVMLGLLPRMAGADAVMIMHPAERQGPGYLDIWKRCRRTGFPWVACDRCARQSAGGSHLSMRLQSAMIWVRTLFSGIGGAIQGHPDGAAAGAKAMLRAVEAAVKGVALEEAAAECPELQTAIAAWR